MFEFPNVQFWNGHDPDHSKTRPLEIRTSKSLITHYKSELNQLFFRYFQHILTQFSEKDLSTVILVHCSDHVLKNRPFKNGHFSSLQKLEQSVIQIPNIVEFNYPDPTCTLSTLDVECLDVGCVIDRIQINCSRDSILDAWY